MNAQDLLLSYLHYKFEVLLKAFIWNSVIGMILRQACVQFHPLHLDLLLPSLTTGFSADMLTITILTLS